jgi:hypothetical protein
LSVWLYAYLPLRVVQHRLDEHAEWGKIFGVKWFSYPAGICISSLNSEFDYLVGDREHAGRNGQALKRLIQIKISRNSMR